VALLHRVADQRVFGLQVEDVELVDARRHQQQRPLVHLGRASALIGLYSMQLETVSFSNTTAPSVVATLLADLEQRFRPSC
jgi:hypothetical protein